MNLARVPRIFLMVKRINLDRRINASVQRRPSFLDDDSAEFFPSVLFARSLPAGHVPVTAPCMLRAARFAEQEKTGLTERCLH